MAAVGKFVAGLLRALRLAWGLIAGVFAALFGSIDWYAPDWLRFLGRKLSTAFQRLIAAGRAQPRRSAGLALLGLVLVGAGVAGWRWYQALPKPRLVSFTVEVPARTCYECDPPGAPNALVLHFSESAAPLEAAGKDLAPGRSQPRMDPTQSGHWRWRDDKTLAFEPGADWPVGNVFRVRLAHRGLIAPQLRLDREDFEFTAPAFAARIKGTEFYQDPVVASAKKAVLTLAFTHPVDPAELQKRIGLNLYDKIADGKEEDLGEVAYTLSYDKLKLEAYISSEQLKVPAKEARLAFHIDAGLRAARGGNQTAEPLKSDVKVPGIDSLVVNALKLELARDENNDPQQVAVLEYSFPVPEKETPSRFRAWLLPDKHPDATLQARYEEDHPGEPYDWSNGVDNRILDQAQRLELSQVTGERENSELQSFRYSADPGRYVYLRLDKGLQSFGGYRLGQTQERVLRVPEYPRELRVVAPGALLAMSGPKQLNVLARDVPAMKVEVSRLLPRQLQHLVSQTRGDLANPQFSSYGFDQDNLTERFSKTERLARLAPGKPSYTTLDLAPYLRDEASDRRGIFLLKLQAWDADHNRAVSTPQVNEWGDTVDSPVQDTRLVVVTDLGLVSKRNLDGSSEVFVQSIHDGRPVEGVRVDVIGRNGLSVLERSTDADGHAHFPSLKDFHREQEPVLLLAQRNGDSSFLPLDYRMRQLDLSRFDVGGAANAADRAALSAYLFSDRGVYRPGEEIHIGAIVRTQDWNALPAGLPLLLEVTDPRGQVVRKERLPLSAQGFEDIRHLTQAASPTGTWTFSLSIVKDRYRNDLVGSVTVLVREFEPDRMKMSAHLSAQRAQGWVSPDQLSASADLQNLFGAPAENRRVTASLRLSPALPDFPQYPGYQFSDPQVAKEGFTEELAATTTDAKGSAQLDLRLERFARATYRLQLVTQGFEADGGRSVAAEVTQLVSNMPYLVGVKADGALDYVGKNAQRSAELIAVDSQLARTEARDLHLKRIEVRYVSTLVKQNNGTYKYESRKREVPLSDDALTLPAAGHRLALDTRQPGHFAYLVLDAAQQQLARLDYTVAGEANLSARLEKNAELQLALSKKDYAPGEPIEIQINAPYTGAGLITIERDKVYAWKWFSADTTASTQRIALPAGIEGNAYVSVTFVRDPGSAEIYTRPLSYGVAPFSIDLDARRSQLAVTLPERVKPGATAQFRYHADRPSKMVLFAVDEGILQVARYVTPDPLAFLFQKKSLDIRTTQILDLILPEFRAALMQAAPGGDADGLLAKHLNPFKRRGDAPVAYWSGIVDADPQERTLEYTVPDSFNGRLRVMAVAVSQTSIGVFDGATLVRGDFVLSPNVPAFVAPGDRFEVSLGVSNQAAGSGAAARPGVQLKAGKGLKLVGAAEQTIAVAEGHEAALRFQLEATDELGNASLDFRVQLGDKLATRRVGLSVRPSVPYQTTLSAGVVAPGKAAELAVARQLYPQLREQEAGFSVLPLGLARGFVTYLGHYPYACTEQLVSQAMPAVVLSRRPEFGVVQGDALRGMVGELRARQTPDGAYRYWPGGFETQEFVSIYAQHVLIEARERGQDVPPDLIDQGNEYLRTLAARDADNLEQERNGAYALYLLTRQGQTLGAEASRLRERLQSRYKKQGRTDLATAYLAAAMQLMKQQREAEDLFAQVDGRGSQRVDDWHDEMTSDAVLLYLAARHFPERLKTLPADVLDRLAQHISQGRYHSLSAATTLLALDAYAGAVSATGSDKLSIAELGVDGRAHPLTLPHNLFPKVDVSAEARRLRFGNDSDLPAFSLLAQSGFDRKPTTDVVREGFEILREYTDASGAALASIRQGDEIAVHLKFRSLTPESVSNVALVDLLPGGFELVVPPRDAQTRLGQASSSPAGDPIAPDGEAEIDEGGNTVDAATSPWTCPICQAGTRATLSFVDFRDDRNVFYVTAGPQLSELVYRIKATHIGRYSVPPAFGEGMYRPEFRARSAASTIVVEAAR